MALNTEPLYSAGTYNFKINLGRLMWMSVQEYIQERCHCLLYKTYTNVIEFITQIFFEGLSDGNS